MPFAALAVVPSFPQIATVNPILLGKWFASRLKRGTDDRFEPRVAEELTAILKEVEADA